MPSRTSFVPSFLLATVIVSSATLACGGGGGTPATPSLSEVGDTPAKQVRVLELPGRPRTILVARHGDPSAAVAVAFAPGGIDGAAVAARLEADLAKAGLGPLLVHLDDSGGYVSALTRTPDDAGNAIAVVSESLTRAATDMPSGKRDSTGSPIPTAGPAASTLPSGASCAAAFSDGPRIPSANAKGGERSRASGGLAGLGPQTAWIRFAAVGSPDYLDAVREAVNALDPWPAGTLAVPPWPASDRFAAVPAVAGAPGLAVALRLPSAGAAMGAAQQLGAPDSPLAIQLGALGRGWQLDAVVAEASIEGGCLLVELTPKAHQVGPNHAEIARAARLTAEEAQKLAEEQAESTWAFAESVLRNSDPRGAAASASWQSLSTSTDEPVRYSIEWRAEDDRDVSGAALERMFNDIGEQWERPSIDAAVREEPGQAELWVLLASPCGTSFEGSTDAGLGALAVSTAARASRDDTTLEPWIAPDGLGIVAHAARRATDESLGQLAHRVGKALASALVRRASPEWAFMDARTATLTLLGTRPSPGFWASLEALSPGHPSWLLPEGTPEALVNADLPRAHARLRTLLGGPLRVAVLANGGSEQVPHLLDTLEEWLRPLRDARRPCPASPAPALPIWGLTRLEAAASEEQATYVGVTLPTFGAALGDEARWTAWLLNRAGGWLSTVLEESELAATARATLLGGPRAAALIVEIRATPEAREAAVMHVRGLFARLYAGAVRETEAAAAQQHFAAAHLLNDLDPRHRLVSRWRSPDPGGSPISIEDLRRFHAQAFAPGHVAVVELAVEP